MTRIGAIFNPYQHHPSELAAVARDADAAGLDELWLWEDCFRHSGLAAASAALAVTERLHVGVGILPLPLRNAAVAAMEVATVAQMFPGRFLPGFGHGVQDWMAQAGVRKASPLTLMREAVPAIRALLAGDELTVEGRYVTLHQVSLATPPEVVPRVYAAAEGPRTLEAAGLSADGVVLDSRHSASELREMVASVQSARPNGSAADVVAYVVAAFGAGSADAVAGALGDRGVDSDRAVWGSPADVAASVRRLAAAGVDSVVLLPADPAAPLARFVQQAAEVRELVAAGA